LRIDSGESRDYGERLTTSSTFLEIVGDLADSDNEDLVTAVEETMAVAMDEDDWRSRRVWSLS